jgi:hypothetical protein
MKNDFLDLDEMTAFDGEIFDAVQTPAQPRQPQQQQATGFYAQPQPVQQPQPQPQQFYAQPNPIAQLHQQQAARAMDSLLQGFATEAGKTQAGVWQVAQAGAAGLPGFLKKVAQVGGLVALAMWGDVLIEPIVHEPIAKHFISSVAPGDGQAYVFDPSKPFSEQHWTIQAKTKQAVNVILFTVAILALVFWEPKTPAGVAFKYKFLLALAFLAAPIALF